MRWKPGEQAGVQGRIMHSPGAASRSPIGATALLVAAHARCVAATLATNNEAKFGRVPDPKMEHWLAGVAE